MSSTDQQSTSGATTVTAPGDLPVICIEREFAAPAERVQRAHADPELFVSWVGPHDIESEVDYWDCRTGGAWRYVSRRGEERFAFFGSFHEVAPGRLVQTFTFEGVPEEASLETLTFTDLPGGRSRLEGRSVFSSMQARDAMVASGCEAGIQAGYESLDGLLADPAARA